MVTLPVPKWLYNTAFSPEAQNFWTIAMLSVVFAGSAAHITLILAGFLPFWIQAICAAITFLTTLRLFANRLRGLFPNQLLVMSFAGIILSMILIMLNLGGLLL